MASTKERARWEKWYDEVSARMERQKKAITRLTLLMLEARAALEEIKGLDPRDKEGYNKAQMRAGEAIDRLDQIAAAGGPGTEESEGEEDPIPDPRNNHGT